MDVTVIRSIEGLGSLKIPVLKKRYRELFGEESKSSNKQYLFRRIAFRLQANAEGDLSERARRRIGDIADDRIFAFERRRNSWLGQIAVHRSLTARGRRRITDCRDRVRCSRGESGIGRSLSRCLTTDSSTSPAATVR